MWINTKKVNHHILILKVLQVKKPSEINKIDINHRFILRGSEPMAGNVHI